MNKLPKAILFDLDGTLIHSAPDLRAAANHVCAQRGIEPFDLKRIISFIGNGVPTLVKRLFDARDICLSEDEAQEAIGEFLAYYDQHATDLTRPYDGVVEVLSWLRGKSIPMGIVTNKPEAPAIAILGALEMDHYFQVVVGGDTTDEKKPNPLPYHFACERLGLLPSQSIYIGDSETDANTAKAVEIPFGLYTRGYRNASIDEIAPSIKFDHFEQLPALLEIPEPT